MGAAAPAPVRSLFPEQRLRGCRSSEQLWAKMRLSFPAAMQFFLCLVTPRGCGARESPSSTVAVATGPFTCRPASRGLSGTADAPAASPRPLGPTLVRQGLRVPHHMSQVRPAAVISGQCRGHPRQAWRPAAGGTAGRGRDVWTDPSTQQRPAVGPFPVKGGGQSGRTPLQLTPWGCTPPPYSARRRAATTGIGSRRLRGAGREVTLLLVPLAPTSGLRSASLCSG